MIRNVTPRRLQTSLRMINLDVTDSRMTPSMTVISFGPLRVMCKPKFRIQWTCPAARVRIMPETCASSKSDRATNRSRSLGKAGYRVASGPRHRAKREGRSAGRYWGLCAWFSSPTYGRSQRKKWGITANKNGDFFLEFYMRRCCPPAAMQHGGMVMWGLGEEPPWILLHGKPSRS